MSKFFIVVFTFILSFYILHTTYYIPPAFAEAPVHEIPNCESQTQIPVTANLEAHENYLDIESKANIPPEINEEIKNNPQKDKKICPGISRGWLADILGILTCSIPFISDYCPQNLSLGDNTVVFDSKTALYKNAYIYTDLSYEPQPYKKEVIEDPQDSPETIGNQVISDITDRAGLNYGNYYSTEYPREVYIEGSSTPVKLGDKLDNSAALTQRDEIEKERTGQLGTSWCLYSAGTFYPGIQIEALKDIDCSELIPPASEL